MNRRRALSIAAILFACAILVTGMKLLEVQWFEGDTALFFQTAEHIAHGEGATSSIFTSIQSAQHSPFFRDSLAQLRADPLVSPPFSDDRVLTLHAYFILFPLGWLTVLLPVGVVLLGAFALVFMGLLYCAIAMVSARGVPLVGAVLFAAIVATHPAFSDSLLYGQFYPDRFFMLGGMLLLLAATRERTNRAALVAAALLCASIDERGALVGGVILVLCTLLVPAASNDRRLKYALGAALILVALAESHFFLVHGDNGGYFGANPAKFVAILLNPILMRLSLVFLMVSIPLLAFAFFEWRSALVAVATMLPNLLGTIGGAEKVGFSTHYHSYYFPVLVWAAALGFARLYRIATARNRARVMLAATAAILLIACSFDPYAGIPRLSLARIGQSFIPALITNAQNDYSAAGIAHSRLENALRAAVPRGALVSAPESAMTALYSGRRIVFFPLDIETAEYVIRPVTVLPDGTYEYSGLVSRLQGTTLARANAMLTRRMRRAGFDVDHPLVISGLALAVIHRRAGRPR